MPLNTYLVAITDAETFHKRFRARTPEDALRDAQRDWDQNGATFWEFASNELGDCHIIHEIAPKPTVRHG